MTQFDITYTDFKREDTTNDITIKLYADNKRPIIPDSSHTWKAKVAKDDKYVGEYPVTIFGNMIKLSSSNLTRLPDGNYSLELWETYDGSTAIYPSVGVMTFRVHKNVDDTLGTIDPTTDINAIIDDLHKAGQNIKVVATNTLPAGSKASVTQSIANGENQLTFNIPQGEQGEQGDVGPAPTLKIGTVTKLGPDQMPTASLSGGNGSYTLDMGIPQGAQGETNPTATQALNVANSVNSRLDGIISNGGGRNLLRGTRDFKQWGTSISKVAVTNGQEKFQAATGTADPSQTRFDLIAFDAIPLEKDTDYTASFWVKTSEDTEIWSYFFDSGSNGIYADGATINHSTTDYTRVITHFHNGNNNTAPSFIPVRINKKSSITVWLYGCMLEKGMIAHEWQPAPEDTQTQIDANKTAATNAQNTANSAKSTADSANNNANSAINTANQANNKVTEIQANGGGRNLWIGSQNLEHVSNDGNATTFSKDGSCMVAHIPAENGFYSNGAQIYANNTDPFKVGDSETFSLEMKGTGSVTINRQDNFEKTVTLTDQWKRYSVSGTVTKLNSAHTIWSYNANDDIYVRLPMVERGTVAHDWQPAPEDTQSEIDALKEAVRKLGGTI